MGEVKKDSLEKIAKATKLTPAQLRELAAKIAAKKQKEFWELVQYGTDYPYS